MIMENDNSVVLAHKMLIGSINYDNCIIITVGTR